ncbi:cytochrome P450 [Cubamyces sp. BRFM 1775]|nr:cytochrome P450 [Cubamyces sp. BRFM 1775]
MSSSIRLQLVGCLLAVLYTVWRIVRSFVVKSPLDNIPGAESDSWLMGNIAKLKHPKDSWTFQRSLVERYGRVFTFYGILNMKWLYTYDPRALHSIYIKDQDVFQESDVLTTSFGLFVGPAVIATLGEQHRKQRKMINPAFSVKHLREMNPIFNDVIRKLEIAIASRVKDGPKEIDILGWMGRTALELIGQGGLGYSFDPLTEDKADEFAESLKGFFPVEGQIPGIIHVSLPKLVRIGPAWFRRKVAEMVPRPFAQRMLRISDIMHAQSVRIIKEKRAALERGDEALKQQVGEGKDLMSVLLRGNMIASEEERLSEEELIAQVSALVLAAMDTTSNALSRTLYQLAQYPEAQEKLREELKQARDDGAGGLRDLDYDEVMELPYLDAVCRETLRRFNLAPITDKRISVTKDAVLPLSAPIQGKDGSMIESIPVRKGMRVLTDLEASNCNKELWGEDAYEWKPERWLKPLPSAVDDAHIPGVYSHLMTFIGGSRSCVGFKFSQLEMKLVLATLLPAFKFEVSKQTICWNAAGVCYPSVGEHLTKPAMPLIVTSLKA